MTFDIPAWMRERICPYNYRDSNQCPRCRRNRKYFIHEDDEVIYSRSKYSGAEEQEEIWNDRHLSRVDFCTNKSSPSIKVSDSCKGINRCK